MIESLYNSLGFFLTLGILYVGFGVFIFWIAGLAGISSLPDSENKTKKIVIGVLFPPYPLFWLVYDIFRHYKLMQEDDI